jgi:MFS family permease
MMVVAAFSSWIETLIILNSHSFSSFALAIGIGAIGGACLSGSRNAMLYDTLMLLGRKEQFERVYANMALADKLSAGIAALIGSMYIAGFGLEWNYRITMISMTIVLAATILLTEPDRMMQSERRSILSDALRVLMGNKSLLEIVLYGALTAAAINYIDEFWQYYFRDLGVKVFFFGIIGCAAMIVSGLGEIAGSRLNKRIGTRKLLTLIYIAYVIAFAAAGFVHIWYLGVIFVMLAYFCAASVEPIIYGELHHACESSYRATAESFQSLGRRGITIVLGFLFGFVVNRFHVATGFFVIAIVLIGVVILYQLI